MYIPAMNGGEVFFVAIDQNVCEPVVLVIEASLAGFDFYKANGFEAAGEPVLLPGMQLLIVPMRKTIGG
jgi:hypothetical protein